jgi:hypothetical protein
LVGPHSYFLDLLEVDALRPAKLGLELSHALSDAVAPADVAIAAPVLVVIFLAQGPLRPAVGMGRPASLTRAQVVTSEKTSGQAKPHWFRFRRD